MVTGTKDFQAENTCGTEENKHGPLLACVELLHLDLNVIAPTFLACICNLVDCILSGLSQCVCCN